MTLRSGVLPWLKRMTADAPAAWALRPSGRNRTRPAGPARCCRRGRSRSRSDRPGRATSGAPTAASVNAPSHPLVLARGGTRLMSTAVDGRRDGPDGEPVNAPVE